MRVIDCKFDKIPTMAEVLENKVKEGNYQASEEIALATELGKYLKNNILTGEQVKGLANWMKFTSLIPRMELWAHLQENTKNLFKVHKLIEELMLASITGSRSK